MKIQPTRHTETPTAVVRRARLYPKLEKTVALVFQAWMIGDILEASSKAPEGIVAMHRMPVSGLLKGGPGTSWIKLERTSRLQQRCQGGTDASIMGHQLRKL